VGLARLGAFNDTPGEEGGVYLSNTEKDEVVAANGIPDMSRLSGTVHRHHGAYRRCNLLDTFKSIALRVYSSLCAVRNGHVESSAPLDTCQIRVVD
jgi:hypothetical protein